MEMGNISTLTWTIDKDRKVLMIKAEEFFAATETEMWELIVSKRSDGGLLLQLHTNTKANLIYDMVISAASKNENEPMLKWMPEKSQVSTMIYTDNGKSVDGIAYLSRGSIEKINIYLGLKKEAEDKPTLERIYDFLPAGVLENLKNQTVFIYLVKTSDTLFSRFLKNDEIDFEVETTETRMCIRLLNNGYILGQASIEKESIDEKMLNEYTKLVNSHMITVFINNEDGSNDAKITKIKALNNEMRNRIIKFLDIPMDKQSLN